MKTPDNKIIEVCSECKTAVCWYGEFMCDKARDAGTVKMTVGELKKLNAGEHEDSWSDETMTKICGDPAPHGYKTDTVIMPEELTAENIELNYCPKCGTKL